MKILQNINLKSFIEYFIDNLVMTKRMKFAFPTSFLVLNFESTTDQAADEYLTVAQLAERYPAFSQGSIRWLIFNKDVNNFHKVVRKIGRKVILNLRSFREYVEEQSSK